VENAVTVVSRAGGNGSQIFSGMTGIIKSLFAGKMFSTENIIIGKVYGTSLIIILMLPNHSDKLSGLSPDS
jgi:hypothetical protein